MSAVKETGRKVSEFSGKYKKYTGKIDGQAGTGGTLTIPEFDEIAGIQMTFAQKPTADCAQLYVYSVSGNVITFGSVEDDCTTVNTQNPLDFYVEVIGRQTE
jgi:hypothetical protein